MKYGGHHAPDRRDVILQKGAASTCHPDLKAFICLQNALFLPGFGE